MATSPRRVVYVTSSTHKKQEALLFQSEALLRSGAPVRDKFEFVFVQVPVKETLEEDLETMVRAEVLSAYSQVRIPCIVEHAGLIFDGYDRYPGGLTKPMWNTLQDRFLEETHSANRRATARAVVAYCDGLAVKTFEGSTPGVLADRVRGKREFYWDTVFIPDDPTGKSKGLTYSEVVDDPGLGLAHKVLHLSQSFRAMRQLLEFIQESPPPKLWSWTA
jgi:inosine/xanthosine triphosphate pyrophosphatase family protein